ncbi:MAG: TonB-dependent receptor [Bacteroidales bacterium]|nr:TonB-dependent receptor [Bacteroidales bacterium]MBN2762190.1 TonB-dependent receptor [Bacteroidales bacterium]
MSRLHIFSVILFFSIQCTVFSQKTKTDANIVGHVVCCGKHISFASVSIKGTTIGTVTDETGHYQLINVPAGEITIMASMIGYKTQEKTIIAKANRTEEIKFDLEEDIQHLEEVVVSGNRTEQRRVDAPVIINTISSRLYNSSQSVTLGEGLNFSPGLRLENNCQNCGFTQVRMNGMEGPYSQILINNRPVFSGLAGVYGLELIPANMIEKVEVVRGGGSALFGSNAIAGTINLILKDPVINSYEAGVHYALTGIGVNEGESSAPDYSAHMNTSMVSDDRKTGMALFGFARERKMFDANSDEFSEIAPMNNLTLGTRLFHRFGYRNKLTMDFFVIKEQRDGGNKQDLPLHERDIAESVKHNLKTGAVTYEQFFRHYDLLSVYASGQFLNRDSYYGANQSLVDYGNSSDKTCNVGAQYKAVFDNTSIIAGIENTSGFLNDKKLGYPDFDNAVIVNDSVVNLPHTGNTIVADQSSVISAGFVQVEAKFQKVKIAVGARYDHFKVKNLAENTGDIKKGNVFSPRISIMYEVIRELQARVSYSQGFRAPQIFDEDLHIETSGLRKVIHVNDPGLKQENSQSLMASLDFNGMIGSFYTGILLEGFYTRLDNPFVNDIGDPDETGTVRYTRINAADGATVAGINMEFKLKPQNDFSLTSGFTLQSSQYDVAQEFDERRFFRTPGQYGYFVIDWDFAPDFCLSVTGNFTGCMLVPHFGFDIIADYENSQYNEYEQGLPMTPYEDNVLSAERIYEISQIREGNVIEGSELYESPVFFDAGVKLTYTAKLNGASLQCFGGIKNVFNSWQSDFDKGIDRDPAYMYGPLLPRTVYLGIKIGNIMGKSFVNEQNKVNLRHERRHLNRQQRRHNRFN